MALNAKSNGLASGGKLSLGSVRGHLAGILAKEYKRPVLSLRRESGKQDLPGRAEALPTCKAL